MDNFDILDPIQTLCVHHKDGPALVLSGAGTGKTRVIVNRFQFLINEGVETNKILCLTFSNKAANEIGERLQERRIRASWVGTFHGICFRLMQMYKIIDDKTILLDELDSRKIADQLGVSLHLNNIQRMKDWAHINYSEDLNNAANIYENYLTKNNMVDFGDLIIKMIDTMENNEEIRNAIKNRFDYIMIDEFQDTSKSQYHLIKLLLKDNNIFCVGDDDQSIYEWRGAYVGNILNFSKEFDGCQVFKMEQNYRSTNAILQVANSIISNNVNRLPKEIWTHKTGENVIVCCTKNDMEFIGKTIKTLPENESIGILVRASSSIKPIEEVLIKYKINYKVMGGVRFFETKEIKIVTSYLRFLFKQDLLSMERIINFPRRGLGEKKLEIIRNNIDNGMNMIDAIGIVHPQFSEQLKKWEKLTGTTAQIIEKILKDSGAWEEFETEKKLENIKILMGKTIHMSIEQFFTEFFTMDHSEECATVIMTIHGAKGLEFTNVFIPHMMEGNFPNGRSVDEGNVEEERRLAYVATTRAKSRLFFSYNIDSPPTFFNKKNFGPSRFLFNLPSSYVTYITD